MNSGSSLLQEPAIERVHFSKSYQRSSLKRIQRRRKLRISIKALRRKTQYVRNIGEKALKEKAVISSATQCTKVGNVVFRKLKDNRLGFVSRLGLTRKRVGERHKAHAVKLVLARMLRVRIAHGMDPVQRAGQTKSSNEKEASRYGRSTRKKKSLFMSLCKILIQLLFLTMFPLLFSKNFIVKGALNSLKSSYKPKKKQKNKSFVSRVLRPRIGLAFAR